MWSLALDIAMVASDSYDDGDDNNARGKLQVSTRRNSLRTKRVSTTTTYHVSNFHRVDLDSAFGLNNDLTITDFRLATFFTSSLRPRLWMLYRDEQTATGSHHPSCISKACIVGLGRP